MPIMQSLFGCPLTKTGHLYTQTATDVNLDKFMNPPSNDNSIINQAFNDNTVYVGLVSQTKAQQTVATYFRFSLMDLLHKLTNGSPHFVRCLKPNDTKQALVFGKDKILEQLQYTGIMETIKIRQHGFSHRIGFADFLRRYSFLVFSFEERVVANRETCRLLLIRLNMDGCVIGKTKVFLKYYHVEYLSRIYEDQIKKIIRVQAFARRWLAKRRADKERWSVARSVVIMQKYARGWLARKRMSDVKALTIVKNIKAARMASAISESASSSPDLSPKRRALESNGNRSDHHEVHVRVDNNQSPAEAAVLIQKYIRGYLTRKKIKPSQGNANSKPQFVSERMQLYQTDNNDIYGRNDNHNNRPKLSPPNNNQRNANSNANYPNHFNKLDLPLQVK